MTVTALSDPKCHRFCHVGLIVSFPHSNWCKTARSRKLIIIISVHCKQVSERKVESVPAYLTISRPNRTGTRVK